jgi:hypothetical protein
MSDPGYQIETDAPFTKANGQSAPPFGKRIRFEITNINDIVIPDDAMWLIEDILPAGPSLIELFGLPKTGKSFVAADVLMHVARGKAYCGLPVMQGATVYVTSEGIRGFKRRMIAMRRHYDVEAQQVPLYIAHEMPDLGSKSGDADILAERILAAVPEGMAVAAVCIDTLARATVGKNDSASEDMGVFVENCDIIARKLTCAVIAIHHSPRGDLTRGRGSNAVDGAADAMISVVALRDGTSRVTVEELKDGESSLSWRFRVVKVEIDDRNKNGCFAGLCETIGTPVRIDSTETKTETKRTPTQNRFISILAEALLDAGALVPLSGLVPPVPFNIKAVTRAQLKKSLLNAGFLDPEKKDSGRSVMSNLINVLSGRNIIGSNADHVWLPTP